MIGSVVVVGALTPILLHFARNLKKVQVNEQRSQIWELLLYEFELGHNAAEVTKNICCAKGEGRVDQSTITRRSKKFYFGCKNFDDRARSDRPKTMDSEDLLQAIEANLPGSTCRVRRSWHLTIQCGSVPS